LPFTRVTSLLASAVACALLLCAVPGHALAQQLPDVYPDAVPAAPPAPVLGPVPDVAAIPGQSRTPPPGDDCTRGTRPAAIPASDPRAVDPLAPNPLRGQRWYVDPREPAWGSYVSYTRRGQRSRAALMWRVAREPRFRWFGRWTGPDTRSNVHTYLRCVAAVQPGAVPLMVVMRHQGRACSPDYMAGDAAEDAATRTWYDDFAAAVGDARVVIGFEPDSLGTLECLAPERRTARLDNLAYGVEVLSRLPNATIYLEGGAADWEPAARTADQLRRIGIDKVRGFMVNATHHAWTLASIRHGLAISRLVGGKPFIVNTSYNGRGPFSMRGRGRRSINVWCHPPRRGLGISPTTRTGHPKVDAFMWINRPGYSAGACNGGPLPVGSWWPKRALMYARFQTSWLSPPRGSILGFKADGRRRASGRPPRRDAERSRQR
jgi:endoglucanase